jgi:hypothetical protein
MFVQRGERVRDGYDDMGMCIMRVFSLCGVFFSFPTYVIWDALFWLGSMVGTDLYGKQFLGTGE